MSQELNILFSAKEIKRSAWDGLVVQSPVASWFQTPEAYDFFDSISFFEAFCVAVEHSGSLKGIVVGYVQKDGGKVKQFFSRRAIINGGPLLADDINDNELSVLLNATKSILKRKAIFVETRNFNDYSCWRGTFERNGFLYEPHLNFHLDCSDFELAESNIGRHRRRYIRLSQKNGASIVDNPTIENIRDYYSVLNELYKKKVKVALFPFEFFSKLFATKTCRYVLIEYDGAIVGGSVCVYTTTTAYEWFACGKDGLYKNVYPSSLTKYAGIKFAHNYGCHIFDMMGAGKPDEEYGVRDFKAEFGGKLVEHGRYKYICKPLLYKIGTIGVKILKKL